MSLGLGLGLGNLFSDMGTYEPRRENITGYTLVIPELSGVATLTLNLLMYRLNNLPVPVEIIVFDRKKVTDRDLGKGLYLQKDLGLLRADVIQDKYTKGFNNITIVKVESPINYKRTSRDRRKSLIVLDFSENNDHLSLFNDKLEVATKFNYTRQNNAYIGVREVSREEFVVKTELVSSVRLESEEYETVEKEGFRLNKQDALAKDYLMAVSVVSIVNNLVTDGGVLTFKGMKLGLNRTYKEGISTEEVEGLESDDFDSDMEDDIGYANQVGARAFMGAV